jgi:hypothetical protein
MQCDKWILSCRQRPIRSVDLRLKEKQILDKVLGTKVYDRRIRPGGVGNVTLGKEVINRRPNQFVGLAK